MFVSVVSVTLHETIVKIGMTFKKIVCTVGDSLAGGILLKMLKYFEVMLSILESFRT